MSGGGSETRTTGTTNQKQKANTTSDANASGWQTVNSSTTQATNPYAVAQANVDQILASVGQLGSDSSNFEHQVGDTTQQAWDSYTDIANAGSAALGSLEQLQSNAGNVSQTGFDQINETASGAYLNSNPYVSEIADQLTNDITNAVNSQFSAYGRYGSASHADTIADEVGSVLNDLYYNNYTTERGYQEDAAKTAASYGTTAADAGAGIDQANLQMADVLSQVGAQQDEVTNYNNQADLRATDWMSQNTLPYATAFSTEQQDQYAATATDQNTSTTTSADSTTSGTTTQTTEQEQEMDLLGSIIGGGLTLAGMGGDSIFGNWLKG